MLSVIESIHSIVPTLLWVSLLVLGLWGVFRAVREQELKGVFLQVTMVAQIGLIVQAVLGVILWIAGEWPVMFKRSNLPLILVLLGVTALILTACGDKIHIRDVSKAERQAGLAEAGTNINGDGSVDGDADSGQKVYQQFCKGCHGADGRDENSGDEASPEWIGTSANADLLAFFEIINFGDRERKMPGFDDKLSQQDLLDVLAYAQTLPTE